MPDPILIAIAASLASKAAGSLYDLVKTAFTNRREALDALTAAEGAAPSSSALVALAAELEKAEAADPTFRESLHSQWASIKGEALQGGTANQITGDVGKAVQARDIQGGVNLGSGDVLG